MPPRPSKVATFSTSSWPLRPGDEADEQGNGTPRPAGPFPRGLMNEQAPAAPSCVWARGSSTGPRSGRIFLLSRTGSYPEWGEGVCECECVCTRTRVCPIFKNSLLRLECGTEEATCLCDTDDPFAVGSKAERWSPRAARGHGRGPSPAPPGASGCRRRSAGGGPGHEAAGWPSAAAGRSLGKTLFACGRLCFKFSREETAPEIRSLSSSFRFKAEFLAAASLPSSGTPHSPSEATRGHDLSAPSLRRRLAAELRDVASPTHTHSGAGEGALGSRDPNWKVAFYEAAFPRNAETKP